MKDKKKGKRRTDLDIDKREKAKDYKDKRTKDGDRFQENIIEKESKLNNFERETKPAYKKSGLSSSQKQIEKHKAKEERNGDTSNLEKVTSESSQVKGVIREEKNLDIGARTKTNNYLGKRVHEKTRFDESIIKKQTKLKQKKSKVIGNKSDENEDIKGDDNSSLDNLKDENNKIIIPNKETDETKEEDYEEPSSDVDNFRKNNKKKDYYKRKAVYDNQKKIGRKDGKLTTDDVKDLKDGMAHRTGEKASSKATGFSEKAEKEYRKSENKLIQKRKKANKLYHKPKYDKTGKLVGGISGASYIASEYIRAGSDENVAIDASEKGLYLNASMTRYAQNKLQRKRRSPIKI